MKEGANKGAMSQLSAAEFQAAGAAQEFHCLGTNSRQGGVGCQSAVCRPELEFLPLLLLVYGS